MANKGETLTPEEIAEQVLTGEIGFKQLVDSQKMTVDSQGKELDPRTYSFEVTDYLGKAISREGEESEEARKRVQEIIEEAEAVGLSEGIQTDGSPRLRLLGLLWAGLAGVSGREVLNVRPRLRIGKGRQMTFLPGSGKMAEKSLRRSNGITERDETGVSRAILNMTVYPVIRTKYPGHWIKKVGFDFGASLREWQSALEVTSAEGTKLVHADSNQYKNGGVAGEIYRFLDRRSDI